MAGHENIVSGHLTFRRMGSENTPYCGRVGVVRPPFQRTLPMAKILCVDDEPHVVTLKCAILEAAGHKVTPSTSAHDAIQKLQHESYDAVVTDWRLGDANGRAVVQAAKSHSSMPVVVVSGYVAEAFQAAEPLADLYLEKPVNPEELVTIVNELLKDGDKAASSR